MPPPLYQSDSVYMVKIGDVVHIKHCLAGCGSPCDSPAWKTLACGEERPVDKKYSGQGRGPLRAALAETNCPGCIAWATAQLLNHKSPYRKDNP